MRRLIQFPLSGHSTQPPVLPDHQRWFPWMGLLVVAASCAVAKPTQAQQAPLNPTLDVGIVQRFGSDTNDEIVLKPQSGDRLTLKFNVEEQPQTVTTTGEIKVDVDLKPVQEPKVVERVVLSTHRSFESAEDSATNWKSQGIEVEIAQPRQWQVWAKRETYKTPLLRRLLMQNLQAHGARAAFIDTQVQQQEPKAEITINGTRYQHDKVEIDSTTKQVEVTFNRDDHGTRLYAGTLKLQPNAYGTYTLVNQVPLETYLRGVVPHEIGLSAPQTAIEAQAILARTYVLRNLRRFAVDDYQICADTQCQVYWGLTEAAPESDRAIATTRGLVLTYQNELVDALYSSTTGGVTAPFSNVWNGPDRPYLQAVVDSVNPIWNLSQQSLADENNFRAFISRKQGFNEDGWDMFRWRVESPLNDIAKDLRTYLQSKQHPLANFAQVKALEVIERSAAGRVQKLAVTTDRGVVELEKDEILRALYAPNSTLFYLEPVYGVAQPSTNSQSTKPNQAILAQTIQKQVSPTVSPQTPTAKVLRGYAFVGGGFGHGVGMSQTGAYHLGKLGWTNERILGFYYPGTQLQPLTSSLTFWREPEPLAK